MIRLFEDLALGRSASLPAEALVLPRLEVSAAKVVSFPGLNCTTVPSPRLC